MPDYTKLTEPPEEPNPERRVVCPGCKRVTNSRFSKPTEEPMHIECWCGTRFVNEDGYDD